LNEKRVLLQNVMGDAAAGSESEGMRAESNHRRDGIPLKNLNNSLVR